MKPLTKVGTSGISLRMPDEKKAPTVFVKGGTTSTAWDRTKKEQYDRTKSGRDQMGRWNEAQRTGRYQSHEGAKVVQGSKAMVASLKLGQDQHPKLLLRYMTGDVTQHQDCLSEILIGLAHPDPRSPTTDSAIILVCPKCLERHGRMDDAQVIIRRSHRHFDFRPYNAGDIRRLWVHPETGQPYEIAGEVTCDDWLTCTALGCGWRFKIDASKVYTR